MRTILVMAVLVAGFTLWNPLALPETDSMHNFTSGKAYTVQSSGEWLTHTFVDARTFQYQRQDMTEELLKQYYADNKGIAAHNTFDLRPEYLPPGWNVQLTATEAHAAKVSLRKGGSSYMIIGELEFTVQFNIPDGTSDGTYDLSVFIRSSNGISQRYAWQVVLSRPSEPQIIEQTKS